MPSRIAAAIRSFAHACRERDATIVATTTISTIITGTTTTGGAGCDGEMV